MDAGSRAYGAARPRLKAAAASVLLTFGLAGSVAAAETTLLALGDTFDAEAAREAGIVYKVVEDDVEAVARETAERLAQKPPKAVAIAREAGFGQ